MIKNSRLQFSMMQIKKFSFLRNFSYQFCTGPLKTLNPTKFAGKLTILPTPIGNLHDLSPNIIKALFRADVIGCEDRRVAGKLYTLIKSKNIMQQMVEDFGEIGLSSIIPFSNGQSQQRTQQQENYLYYEYANMTDKMRKKFLRKMTKQEQQKFKIDFLKYRALKILQKEDDFMKKQKQDKFDELYGIDSSDLQHIQLQIRNTRMKKGRGVLIPLNTYSQTRMFNMVKMFLETKNVAIISDAGMPCISDPGWKMVRKIRESLPDVPIQVIGGPSTVSLITLLASMSAKQNSLSGRFEGFAPQTVSQMTDNRVEIEAAKRKQFSIHFINSKKLRNKVIEMEKNYGSQQKILLANQLTKLYERKYNGTLGELGNLMSKEENEFEGIGELSYLVYPNREKLEQTMKIQSSQKVNEQQKKEQQPLLSEEKPVNLGRLSLISVENFIDSIKQAQSEYIKGKKQSQVETPVTNMANQNGQSAEKQKKKQYKKRDQNQASSKDLIDLICTVFGIKSSQARKIVYEKQIAIKNKHSEKKSPFIDPKQAYQAQQKQNNPSQQEDGQKTSKRVGRRTSRKRSQGFSAQEMQMMKMMGGKSGNIF